MLISRRKVKKFNATYVIASGGGVFGTKGGSAYKLVEKYTIQIPGTVNNSFGSLMVTRHTGAGAAPQKNTGRFLAMGGSNGTQAGRRKSIESLSIRSGGTGVLFGYLDIARGGASCAANKSEAHEVGGIDLSNIEQTTIQKMRFSTNSNSTSFGSLSTGLSGLKSYASKAMMFMSVPSGSGRIDFKSFKHDAVASSFTGLSPDSINSASFVCNWSIGLQLGGQILATYQSLITQFVLKQINSFTNFGNLTVAVFSSSNGSSQSRALNIKGLIGPYAQTKVVDYINYKTRSNATQFSNSGVALEGAGAYGAS